MSRARWSAFGLFLLILLPRPEWAIQRNAVAQDAVQNHLEAVLSVMQSHALRRAEIDWKTFRARVLAEAQRADAGSEPERPIRLALALLADDHSVYVTQAGKVIGASTRRCKADVAPLRAMPPSGVGYVPVLGFVGREQAAEQGHGSGDRVAAQDADDDKMIDIAPLDAKGAADGDRRLPR